MGRRCGTPTFGRESRNMDCLIMPFILNDIISDVDPVKLYEYISMGKNIISVKYREVKRFEKFVYFYREFFGIFGYFKNTYKERRRNCVYGTGAAGISETEFLGQQI